MTTVEAPPFTEADIDLLIAALDKDDLQCQANHVQPLSTKCSIEVRYRVRVTCKGVAKNVCYNEVHDDYAGIYACMEGGIQCSYCNSPVKDCWIVNPI